MKSVIPHLELVKDKSRTNPTPLSPQGYPQNPGGFVVAVGGRPWGMVTLEHHGRHGMTYHLNQITESGRAFQCTEQTKYGSAGRIHTNTIRIWSDKHYLRGLRPGEKQIPLLERIRAMVVEAIRSGNLRDPIVIAAEQRKESDKARAAEARQLQETEAMWHAKATEVIGPVVKSLCTVPVYTDLKARIVDAMKWAQTR